MSVSFAYIHFEQGDTSLYKGMKIDADLSDLVTLVDWAEKDPEVIRKNLGCISTGQRENILTSVTFSRHYIGTVESKTSLEYINSYLCGLGVEYFFVRGLRAIKKVKKPALGRIVIPVHLNGSIVDIYPTVFVPDLRSATESLAELFRQTARMVRKDFLADECAGDLKAPPSTPFLVISEDPSLRGVRFKIYPRI